jgi:hypothetical protein
MSYRLHAKRDAASRSEPDPAESSSTSSVGSDYERPPLFVRKQRSLLELQPGFGVREALLAGELGKLGFQRRDDAADVGLGAPIIAGHENDSVMA